MAFKVQIDALLTAIAMVYIDAKISCRLCGLYVNFCSFKSLFGLSSGADDKESRSHLRRSNAGGGGGRWPGSGGPGGPGRNGGFRRNIGGLPRSSGMSCPPMAAKCLGSAQTDSGMRRDSACGTFSITCLLDYLAPISLQFIATPPHYGRCFVTLTR
ncbi:hypothetical protein OSTOST_06230 [Ostertagia ostertagi]